MNVNNLLVRAGKHIRDDTLLIIDPTDISKKYAKHIQYLSKVRDGSTGELSDGYWVCSVVGAEVDSPAQYRSKITPKTLSV